ncbi:low choriolytic enzyme-like [Battus philenor]|uniref:low choriolytic enzyme-like n=1 Tax=Battus philenor TaxID=42288 RepID=UPI0035CFDB1A
MNAWRIILYFSINSFSLFSNCVRANKLKDWKAQNKLITYYAQKQVGVKWHNGIIPYIFNTKSYDHVIANRLRIAMNVLESVSCIKFKPIIGSPNTNATWLHITNPLMQRDCTHEPLYNGTGEMTLVLGFDCLSEQQILHTLMHGIGFRDEVTHPQRDQYIRILWNNIQPAHHHLFRIQPADMTKTAVEYDPMSVMHFHDRAFSINGHATITPLITGLIIKPSDSLSQLDKMKLRLLFGHECNKRDVDNLMDTCKMAIHRDVDKKKAQDSLESSKSKKVTKHDDINSNDTNAVNGTNNDIQNNEDDDTKNKKLVVENNDEVYEDDVGANTDEDDENKKEKIRGIQAPSESDE